ncbi:MAG TPA: antitoxin [Hyphomonas sp.]|nr:antitoxin [Hyphomonadaceae bacterium]HBL93808.1 antitoxin [Hyphomonas sp.]HCJ18772.1 antitoxin [Hyphomonas sp.]
MSFRFALGQSYRASPFTSRQAAYIERPVYSDWRHRSGFIRGAITREARSVPMTRIRHVLSRAEAAQFAAALDTPPKPTRRALAAAKAYKARVVSAD